VAQDVDGALQRVIAQAAAAHRGESIDTCAEIDGLGGHKDAALGCQLEHEGASTKARTTATSGRVDSGAWRHSRVPSARDRSIWVAAGGWGQEGADGTSTKPRGRGAGATAAGAACRSPRCFLRSARRTRNCVATREGGNAAANATACSHHVGGIRP